MYRSTHWVEGATARFYFTYMRPNLAAIRTNTARGLFDSLTASSLESYFGLAFEQLCIRNIESLLRSLASCLSEEPETD